MNVLIVTNTYPPADLSGVGTLALEMARRLASEGHQVAVLTRRAPPGDPWAVAVGGAKPLFPLRATWRWLRLPAAATADLVHVHESDAVGVALLLRLARLFGRPRGRARLVATLQVSYAEERRAVRPVRADGRVVSRPTPGERLFAWVRAPVLSLLGRVTARLADAVVAPSQRTAEELERDYGARVAAVIPNGVSLGPADGYESGGKTRDSFSQRASLEARGKDPEVTILYAGRLRTRKAVAVLLEAFARLRQRHLKARLALVGNGEQRHALEAQAGRLGLGDAVRFTGSIPRDDVVRELVGADLFCLPSTYEGMPLAILEAMAAGLPVVATSVSGNPEAVKDGVTGLLVPPESATALAEALERLVADPDLRRAMGTSGRRRVAERFAIERVAGQYLDLWRRLL